MHRRTFVETVARSAFGLSVLPFLPTSLQAADAAVADPKRPGFGSAKAVIMLNLAGGMSHIDTFDPKEGRSKGPADPVSTKAGYQLTSFLPELSKVAGKLCIIRSMSAKVGVHEQARYLMRTGFDKRGTIVHPVPGAWAQHYLGASHPTLPSSVCVNRNSNHGNGFFPASTSPLPILDPDDGLANASAPAADSVMNERLALLHDLDHTFTTEVKDESVAAYNDFYESTLRLMRGNDIAAFDLSKEPDPLRERYGRTKFGQGCLLARRLVESGVRFVEVESGGWDMHKDLERSMEDEGAIFDRAFAALLQDLESRGLLDSTLIVVATEFGRKPEFDGSGRGHHPAGFSCVLAGAGTKRGFVHGATDDRGYEPTEGAVTAGDLHATIGYAFGLPIGQPVMSDSGRPFSMGNKGKPVMGVFA